MHKTELKELYLKLFDININSNEYRDYDFTRAFEKKVSKLKGQEIYNLLKKIVEILGSEDLNFYKNLRYDLKKYKRVHVNNSHVIIFYDDITKKVYFEDYEHHDKIYKKRK